MSAQGQRAYDFPALTGRQREVGEYVLRGLESMNGIPISWTDDRREKYHLDTLLRVLEGMLDGHDYLRVNYIDIMDPSKDESPPDWWWTQMKMQADTEGAVPVIDYTLIDPSDIHWLYTEGIDTRPMPRETAPISRTQSRGLGKRLKQAKEKEREAGV